MGKPQRIKHLSASMRPLFLWVAFIFGVLGFLDTFATHFLSTSAANKESAMTHVPYLHWYVWVIVILLVLFFGLLEGSYREHQKISKENELLKSTKKSPLQIIFDSSNPSRRFWSRESAPNPDDPKGSHIPYWEHRVEIYNGSSNETARNVKVTIEHTGQLPQRPYLTVFDKSKENVMDIQPECRELVPVMKWPHPKMQPGMLCGESAWAYGPIKITVSADNMEPTNKVFQFNWETDQMLFDEHDYAVHMRSHADYGRMPLLEFRNVAERYGWDFSKMPKMNGREFVKELRQAGLDRKLTFFGRPKKYDVEELNMNEPLHEISSDHWKDYSINGLLHMTSDYKGKEENKYVESYRMEVMSSQEGRYIDLHVLDDKALPWLIEITNRYKGQ